MAVQTVARGNWRTRAVTGIALTLGAFQLYTAMFGLLTPMLQRSVHLAMVLMLVFILKPSKWPALDIALAVLSAIPPVYLASILDTYIYRAGEVIASDRWVYLILLVVLLEATRRSVENSLVVLALAFLAYYWVGPLLPGILGHGGYDLDRQVVNQLLSTSGIFDSALGAAATYVYMFILFGAFLSASGAGKAFATVSYALAGRSRGGPGKVGVVASSLFGMISGAPVANVSTTGPFIIPLMKQVGYSPEVAAGIIGAAGTGGTILPPIMGAAAFIMAELTGIPYGKIIVAAALPALLYYLGVFLCVDLEAGRTGMRGLPPSELPSLREGLRHSLLFAVPLGVLVFLITVAKVSPLRAGLWGIAAIIATNLLLGPDRLRWPQVIRAFEGAARGTIIVTVAIAVSGIVVGAINQTGLGLKLTELLVLLAEDSTFLLLVGAALAGLVVGFPLPVTASYILLAAIAAPAIAQAGFSLMQAHLFIIYFAAFAPITPPVALASFAAAGIAEANPMTSSYVGWRYSLPAYIVPFMFMFGPELLLEGSWGQILLTVISSVLGVFALSCCVVGWWGRPLAWWRRGLALAAALSLMWCGWQTDLVGAAILIAALGKVRFPLGRVSKVCQS